LSSRRAFYSFTIWQTPEGHLVDFHLDRGLRLHTDPEHKSLYRWAINEIDAQGQQVGQDQIPWVWSLNFTATSCVLGDSFNIESQFQEEEATPPPKITQRQVIHVQLRPGRPWDDEEETSFSMFGTDRIIKSFQLDIHPITDPAKQESCSAWGSVSYTTEIDFRNETTDDCVTFSLFVKPETFARYGAKIAHGLADEIHLRVNAVAGFYSEWSPSISTDRVKVLAGGEEHKVILPTGLDFKPPRLGEVGSAELFINRHLEFRKRAPEPEAVEEMADTGTERAVPVMQSPAANVAFATSGGMFGMLDYRAAKLFWLLMLPLRHAAWFVPWVSIPVAILVASEWYSDYSRPAKIGIAIAAYFIIGFALGIIRTIIEWCLKKGFFWTIDVIPSKGADPKEAETVVLGGKYYLMIKKLTHHIEQWTDDDTASMRQLSPWRIRLFFQRQSEERFRQRVRVMKENYKRTGKQYADLSPAEQKKLIGPYKDPAWQGFFRNTVFVRWRLYSFAS
jgi:hypothetical protein